MSFRPYIFLLASLFAVMPSFAQETDTVYVEEAPVIVRKQVVVELPARRIVRFKDFFVALGYSYGGYTNSQEPDTIHKSIAPIHMPFVQVGKQFNNWSVSIGLARSFSKIDMRYQEHFLHSYEVQRERYDTIGEYTILKPDGHVTVYSIDTIAYKEKVQNPYDSTLYIHKKLSYWTVPLQLAYRIAYKKVYLQPAIGVHFNFNAYPKESTGPKDLSAPHTYISGALGLDIGAILYKNLCLEIGLQGSKQLTSTQSYVHADLYLSRALLKYMF